MVWNPTSFEDQLNPSSSILFAMEQRRPPEYFLEVFADPGSVKEVVKGDTTNIRPLRPSTDYVHRDSAHHILSPFLPCYKTKNTRCA